MLTDRHNGVIASLAVKVPVKVAATSNITLYGEQTIDDEDCVSGDRVLVPAQTSGVENGIYNVSETGWTRSPDCDGKYDLTTGSMVRVVSGTTNANSWFEVTTTGVIEIGTTSITFSKSNENVDELGVLNRAIIGDPGTEGSGINLAGVIYESTFKVSDIDGDNYAQTILHRHSTVLEPLILGARSNSDTEGHSDVTSGQAVIAVYGAGWAGSNYKLFGSWGIVADSGTISNTSAPGKQVWAVTPDGGTTPVTAMSLLNSGVLQLEAHHRVKEGSAPGTPPSGYVAIYAKSDGLLYSKDDAGNETALGTSITLTSDQTWTGSQRGGVTTDNDLSFDMNASNNFSCTPTGTGTLTFTNIASGQSGFILLNNSGGYIISLHSNTKADSNFAATVSAAGTYLVSYYSNGTNVYCVTSGAMA